LIRRIWGILLFISLVAPLATTFILHQIQEIQVKNTVISRFISSIGKDELVKMKFALSEKPVNNSNHTDEFVYQGELYDVLKTEIIGDTINYWCWKDKEDTKLNQQIDQLVSVALGDNPQQQENNTRLLRFLDSLYFSDIPTLPNVYFQDKELTYCYKPLYYPYLVYSPPSAPPEMA
jgi:hypothetical protein